MTNVTATFTHSSGNKMLLTIVPKLPLPFSANRKRPPVMLRAKKKGSDETVAVTAFTDVKMPTAVDEKYALKKNRMGDRCVGGVKKKSDSAPNTSASSAA